MTINTLAAFVALSGPASHGSALDTSALNISPAPVYSHNPLSESSFNFRQQSVEEDIKPQKVSPFLPGLVEDNSWKSVKERTLVGKSVVYTLSADSFVIADHIRRLRTSSDGQLSLMLRIIPDGSEFSPEGSQTKWSASVFLFDSKTKKVSPIQLGSDGRTTISIPAGQATSVADASRCALSDFAIFGTKSNPMVLVSSFTYPKDERSGKLLPPQRIISIASLSGRSIYSGAVNINDELFPHETADVVAHISQAEQKSKISFISSTNRSEPIEIPGKVFGFGFDKSGEFQFSVSNGAAPIFYKVSPGSKDYKQLAEMPDVSEPEEIIPPSGPYVSLSNTAQMFLAESKDTQKIMLSPSTFAQVIGKQSMLLQLKDGVLTYKPLIMSSRDSYDGWLALSNEKQEAEEKASSLLRAITLSLGNRDTLPSPDTLRASIASHLDDPSIMDKFTFDSYPPDSSIERQIGTLHWKRFSISFSGDGSFTIKMNNPI